jgi:hypothetical protein
MRNRLRRRAGVCYAGRMSSAPTTDDPLRPIWHDRLALLANGDTVPLPEAASHYALLRSYGQTDWLAWDPLPLLREVCLGKDIDPEQRREMAANGILPADGSVPDALRSVVLSAVRGHGKYLTVDCPFTDERDRILAEYELAREAVRSHLDPPVAAAFLRYDPTQTATDQFVQGLQREDGGTKTGDPMSYAERIIRMAEERKKNPPPSPPPPAP